MSPAQLSDRELRALLLLRARPGLGERRLTRLLRGHGSAEAVLALPPSKIGPEPDRAAQRGLGVRVERALRLIEAQDVAVMAVHRPGYPPDLEDLADPPPVLFARGELRLLGARSVAVVGTRRPTEYGISATGQLVAGLARAGVVVWSGLARGIDSVAHRVALENCGATVAVLGSGIDVPYPREHAGLLEDIARAGLVLSEFLPGEPPLPHHFPQRNRLIARLAHGILVVEARPDGGALITADAGSGARPIMAVPGPIGRITSMGPNRLIQEGAKLVVEVADILEEIGGPLNADAARARPSARRHWHQVTRPAADPAQLPLRGPEDDTQPAGTCPLDLTDLQALLARAAEPVHVDDLAAGCGLSVGAALAELLELEVAGTVEQVSGKRFRLAARPRPGRHLRPVPD